MIDLTTKVINYAFIHKDVELLELIEQHLKEEIEDYKYEFENSYDLTPDEQDSYELQYEYLKMSNGAYLEDIAKYKKKLELEIDLD